MSHCNDTTVDIELAKTVNNPTPNTGETVRFTLKVTNNGPDTAIDVTVTDIVPSGFTYLSETMTGGDVMDQTNPPGAGLKWIINSLPVSPPASNAVELTFDAIVIPL